MPGRLYMLGFATHFWLCCEFFDRIRPIRILLIIWNLDWLNFMVFMNGWMLIHRNSKNHQHRGYSINESGFRYIVISKSRFGFPWQIEYNSDVIGDVSYIRISLLFLFPVKDGKFSTVVNAQHFLSCYG